jgi:hypothetical protein
VAAGINKRRLSDKMRPMYTQRLPSKATSVSHVERESCWCPDLILFLFGSFQNNCTQIQISSDLGPVLFLRTFKLMNFRLLSLLLCAGAAQSV